MDASNEGSQGALVGRAAPGTAETGVNQQQTAELSSAPLPAGAGGGRRNMPEFVER